MSEKGFTVEDILKELRGKETSSPNVETQQPVQTEPVKMEEPTTEPTIQFQEQAESTKEKNSSEPTEMTQESPDNPASEELQKHEALEEERLRELMLSTAHLKYISLRKNREKMVQGFKLRKSFTMTQPIERNKIEEELRRQQTAESGLPIEELLEMEADTPSTEESVATSSPINEVANRDISLPDQRGGLVFKDSLENIGEFASLKQTDRMRGRLESICSQLRGRMIGLGILSLLGFLFSVLNGFEGGSPIRLVSIADNPLGYCFISLLFLVATVALCYDMFCDGFTVLFRKGLGRYTLYSFGMISVLIMNLALFVMPEMLANESVNLFVPIASLCSLGAIVGRYIGMKRVLKNFRLVSSEEEHYAADILATQQLAEDFTKGALDTYPELVYNKKTPFLSQFIGNSFCEDVTDYLPRFVVPIVGGIALAMGVLSVALGNSPYVALTVFSGILLAGVGVVPFLFVQFPLFNTACSLEKLGGAVLGSDAVEDFSEVNSVMLNANEIFRGKDVTLYGIKTFSSAVIDRVILDATAVLLASKSILGEVFLNIINNREDYLDEVDGVLYEDGMGISAWVDNRRVLIGSRELMINHNVNVPGKEYEEKFIANNRHLVYLANGGELSAVFVIGLECSEDIRNMITGLYNNDIVCIVKTVDPILTRPALALVFDMPEATFRVIPSRLHKEASDLSRNDFPANAAVSNNGSFPAYVYSVLSAKRLNKNIHLGNLISILSLAIPILLFILFTLLGSLSQVGIVMLFLYEIICAVACVLIQKFYRL